MEKKIEQKHMTEDFDEKVPEAFKGKSFSRLSKSMLKALPNHLGREVAEEYYARNGKPN